MRSADPRPRSSRDGSLLLLAIAALALASGCTQGPDVDYTVPADGATGVEPATEIVVGFTSQLDPETATELANFVIFGNGTGTVTTTASLDETGRILTIVPAAPFLSGEQVTVSLTSRMTTSISIPLEDYQFSFRIRGTAAAPEDFDPAETQFLLTDLDPENGTAGLAQRPLVRADFDRNVLATSIAGNARLRGSVTGRRPAIAAGTSLQGQGAAQTAGEVLVQLDSAESPFEPGEQVTITFGSALTSPPAPGSTTPFTLRPYIASYETRGGHVAGGFGEATALALASGTSLPAAASAAFGDLLQFDGPELAILGDDGRIYALRRDPSGPYTLLSSFQTDLPAAMRLADVDDDGLLEIIVVTKTGLLEVLQLIGATIGRAAEPVEFPGGEPHDLEVADLDGDGLLDVVIGLAEGLQFMMQLPQVPGLTGNLEFTGFLPVAGDPLVVPVHEVEAGDLDGDGRTDLVARSPNGTTVLRNAGAFLFAQVSVLTVEPIAGTIRIADFDGDGRREIVTGGVGGAFIHPNSGAGIPAPTWGAVTLPLGATPLTIAVSNIDGDPDHLPDLLAYAPGAAQPLVLHRRASATLADLVPVAIAVDGVPPDGGMALADVDRDGARDILLHGTASGTPRLLLSPSTGVVDAGDPSFAFTLEGPSTVNLGNEVALTVAADLGEDITQFTTAMTWSPSFDLIAVTLDPTTFPGGSSTPSVVEGTGEGYINVDLGGAVISAGDTVPLLTVRFRQPQPQPGTFSFSLENEVEVSATEVGASQVVLESEGIAFPALDEGTVSVTMTSSVPSVTDLTCASVAGGVQLAWSNPANYSSIRIRRNGVFLSSLPGGTTSFLDESPLSSGTVTYLVIGVEGTVESIPLACEVSLFGSLTCVRLESTPTRIRLTWQTGGAYDTISVRRDGNLVGVVAGTQSGYTDETGDLNGHSYSVFGTNDGVDSTPVTCPQGEVPDAPGGSGVLDPVTQVTLVIEQGTATVSWQNGESYDQVTLRRNGTQIAALAGSATQYEDPDLLPATYQYEVRGAADGLAGVFVPSNSVASDLPHPSDLACTLAGGNQIQLSWTNGPQSYSYQAVLVERTAVGTTLGGSAGASEIIATLSGTATSYLDSNVPDGEYSYRVIGTFSMLQAPSSTCEASLQNLFRVFDLATTPGMDATIEVDGQLLSAATGYSLSVRYDADRLTVTDVIVPGIPSVTFDVGDADPQGFRTVLVTVSDADIGPGFGIPLARIAVATTAAFSAVGTAPLDLVSAEVTLAAGGTFVPATADGVLDVEPFGLFFDPANALPGGIVEGWIYGTFAGPIFGYEMTFQFDPDVISVIEITEQGTAGELIFGFVASSFDNVEGFATLAKIVLPGAGGFEPIPPKIAEPLAFVRLMVDVAAVAGDTTLEFADWDAAGDGPIASNYFVDETGFTVDTAGFPGTIHILAPSIPPEITAVEPTIGPSSGGAEVLVTGSGFFGGLQVSFGGVPASAVTLLSGTEALVTTPACPATAVGSPVIVSVNTSFGSDQLAAGYTYEALSIASVSPGVLNPCISSPPAVLVVGTGFSPALQVTFGAAAGTVVQVDPDGRSAQVLPPAFALASPAGTPLVAVTATNPLQGVSVELAGGVEYTLAFIRGDANGDALVNAADLSFLGQAISGTGPLPAIVDAADANDDGLVHVGDLIYLSNWLFVAGSPPPPAPYPGAGFDPTLDGIIDDCP